MPGLVGARVWELSSRVMDWGLPCQDMGPPRSGKRGPIPFPINLGIVMGVVWE